MTTKRFLKRKILNPSYKPKRVGLYLHALNIFIMPRLQRPVQASTNPAKRFLEWKSDDKCFSFYDKEKEQNVLVKKPLKLLFLEHYHGVKGWNDSDHSGIWSNEVFLISEEELEVKTKKRTLAKGLYKDIKEQVKNAGASYIRVVYFMTEKGEIIRMGLKGASVGGIKKEKAIDQQDHKGYSEFYNDVNHLLDNQWIVIDGAHEAKSGKVTYSIPNFTMGEVITREENAMAEACANKLQDYVNGKDKQEPVLKEPEIAEEAIDGLEI